MADTKKNNIDKPVWVYLMVSRNKDNKNKVPNFHERRCTFLSSKGDMSDYINDRFSDFVRHGCHGEFSRLYRSVNSRDVECVKKRFLYEYIMKDIDITKLESKAAAIAAGSACAAEKKWLFDFDDDDILKLDEFVSGVKENTPVTIHKTPHGFAVVAEHGFDTRKILKKWENIVTLKRDGMLFLKSGVKD